MDIISVLRHSTVATNPLNFEMIKVIPKHLIISKFKLYLSILNCVITSDIVGNLEMGL